METFGDQWNNVFSSGSFSNEDAEFMAQLLGNSPLSNESSSAFPSAFFPTDDSTTPTYPNDQRLQIYPLPDNPNTNNIFTSSYSQDNSYSASENYCLNESTHQSSSFSFGLTNRSDSNSLSSISFSFGESPRNQSQAQAQAGPFVVPHNAKHLQIKSTEPMLLLTQISDNNHSNYFIENSKKRPQMSLDHVVTENQRKRNVKPKKSLNVKVNNNNNNNKQSSKTSSCGGSEGDDDIDSSINATSQSQSQSEDVSYGKGKGSRGSASDPQSLYARKRREKINERLKILQNLVPNGTKVDISTMLEEAVQYVKFLQLQIKLLSSDDHWMYAPIAYNGMDIGLDMKITIPTTTTSS